MITLLDVTCILIIGPFALEFLRQGVLFFWDLIGGQR